MALRIGIDVGGTNTDAVLMDGTAVIAKIKTPTTEDVTRGITTALRHVLDTSGTATAQIAGVMIGTTHFTNAVVERKRLEPTAIIRLGLPATAALPPFVDWPEDLADTLGRHAYLSRRPRVRRPRDLAARRRRDQADRRGDQGEGHQAVAISSVFSPVNPAMEQRGGGHPDAEVPGVSVTISSDIGRIGLLERENAAILNACLRSLARQTVAAFRRAITANWASPPPSTSPRTTAPS